MQAVYAYTTLSQTNRYHIDLQRPIVRTLRVLLATLFHSFIVAVWSNLYLRVADGEQILQQSTDSWSVTFRSGSIHAVASKISNNGE